MASKWQSLKSYQMTKNVAPGSRCWLPTSIVNVFSICAKKTWKKTGLSENRTLPNPVEYVFKWNLGCNQFLRPNITSGHPVALWQVKSPCVVFHNHGNL